jgi:L-ascorbate metabolism protein UlaG (beta-lactamase superfamily)
VIYRNLDGTILAKGIGDLLRWQVGDRLARRMPKPADPAYRTPQRANDGAALRAMTPHLTWIGHASFACRLGGKLIVTDPIWRERLGGRRRLAEPGVALSDLPEVDIVTVSHSHYDHLDVPTLQKIAAQREDGPLFIVPRDVGEILIDAGIKRVVELDWWQTHVEESVKITLVPAQHWSMRVPWDRNKRLWGGFVYESPDGTAYHSGDTALSEKVFRAIHERFAAIDWAMLPIGAYEPRWFMQSQHMNPDDAGQAFELLGARVFCAMHWGTFKLTDEPISEPPEKIRAYWDAHGLAAERLWVFDIGETRPLGKPATL